MTKNVTTVRGGGKVHYGMPGMKGHHFPNCRTGAMTNSGTKYTATDRPVDCRNCLATHVDGFAAAAAAISATGKQPEPTEAQPAVAADVEKARETLRRMGQADLDDPNGFYGVTGFRVEAAEANRYPGAIKVTRRQGKHTTRPTNPDRPAPTTTWDKGMQLWSGFLTAVGFRLVRTTDDALYLYGPRDAAAAAPEAEAAPEGEPDAIERAREVLGRAGHRDARADQSAPAGFRLFPVDSSGRHVRVGRAQDGDVARPSGPIWWQQRWDRGIESYAAALETGGFRVLVLDDEGLIVEWPTPGQAVDAARTALIGAEWSEAIGDASGFTLEQRVMDVVTVGRVQGVYRARPTGHQLAAERWDDAFTGYRRTLVDHGFMVMTADDDSLTVRWLGDQVDQWRPGAVQLGHLGRGSDLRHLGPVDSAGRPGKDRAHPEYAKWHGYAITAAELLGLPAATLVDLRIRDSAVFRDLRNGVVVKIGRPGTVDTARTELRAAWWLQTAGMPIAAPICQTPVMVTANRPATCWTDLGDGGLAGAAELGELHRTLHALPIPTHFEIPAYDPWPGIPERLHAARVTEAQRAWLRAWAADLRAEWTEQRDTAPRAVIHGDGGPHNTLRTDAGPVMIDWETVAIGDPLVDLVHAPWEEHPFTPPHPGFADAHAAAYGADPREMPGFRLHWSIRTLKSVLFAARNAHVSAAARAEADHRLTTLIENRPAPWRWSSI